MRGRVPLRLDDDEAHRARERGGDCVNGLVQAAAACPEADLGAAGAQDQDGFPGALPGEGSLGTWAEGTIENLSQSGVLLLGSQRYPENTLVEMIFEMPEEISGQKNSKVLCQGRVIRMKEARAEGPSMSLGLRFWIIGSCTRAASGKKPPRISRIYFFYFLLHCKPGMPRFFVRAFSRLLVSCELFQWRPVDAVCGCI